MLSLATGALRQQFLAGVKREVGQNPALPPQL